MILLEVNFDQGISHVTEWLHELSYAADVAVEDTLTKVARSMQQRAKRKIRTGAKTGALYKRYNPYRLHQASAPGEAPADDTGELADGIKLRNTNSLEVFVEATTAYSALLEFGGLAGKGAYISPRPYFYVSFFEAVDKAERDLTTAFRKAL